MTDRIAVILDTPLLDTAPWADSVFRKAELVPVVNKDIQKALSKDEDARKALLANIADLMGSAETLSPHFRKALHGLYGDRNRLGLYGTVWLVHVDNVAACVVDWSEVSKRANAPGVTEEDREGSIAMAKDFVHERIRKHLPDPDRLLELEGGLTRDQRESMTLEFLKKRGVL